jgi:hypothetical protein
LYDEPNQNARRNARNLADGNPSICGQEVQQTDEGKPLRRMKNKKLRVKNWEEKTTLTMLSAPLSYHR